MNEIKDLSFRRGQLIEKISAASDEIKTIDDRLKYLRSIGFEEDLE